MHQLLSALILSISSNLDTFTLSISYGMNKIRIPFISNLIITVVSTLGTFLSMKFGRIIAYILPNFIANIIGGFALILIGLWFLIDYLKNKSSGENSSNKNLNFKNSFSIALALTINNLGIGISASITGISIFYSTIFTLIMTSLTIILGYWIGESLLGKLIGKYSSFISSILLIILGAYESFL